MNVTPFSLPLSSPLETATGAIEQRRGLLLRCTHRGHDGVGEATPLPGWTESYEDARAALSAAASIADEDGPAAARRELPRSAVAARHGLSTAVLDADAKTDDVSLASWLADGPAPSETVPVNATIGVADRETTVERARAAVDAGFDCCKLKVGRDSVDDDVARVGAVRDAVGDDVELRVDANGSWSRERAERAIEDLAAADVALVEQPLVADDLAGHAKLRGRGVDVALDESLRTASPADIREADAADALVLKPMVLGGPGEAHTLGTWAHEAGLDVVVSNTVDAVVARTAAVHVAAALPAVRACGLATADMLGADLGPDPAPVTDGEIAVPDGPGIGLSEVSVDGD